MASIILNKRAESLTLPFPYSGILPPLGRIVVPGEPAAVLLTLGASASASVELIPVADSELLNNPAAAAVSGLKLFQFLTLAAKSANSVHASLRGDAVNAFPGPFTSPAASRNLRLVFGALWDGGNVTVVGTYRGAAQTETFVAVAGTTVVGTKPFDTVVSASKAAVGTDAGGTNTVTVGTGDKLGIGTANTLVTDAFAILTATGVAIPVTIDLTNQAWTPGTVPDGTIPYVLLARAAFVP